MPEKSFTEYIQAAYPDLMIRRTRMLNSDGQFSIVLIINEALVFRFPRTVEVAAELDREIDILDELQDKLPLSIPDPMFYAQNSETGTLIFMGYPMLQGEPLLRDVFEAIEDETILQQIAQELAQFLKALHTIPPESLEIDFPVQSNTAYWETLYQQFREKLFPHMRPDACQQVTETFESALSNKTLWDFTPVLCHNDFGAGNILYENGHISGIIDFTSCAPGDMAQEVGALLASYGEAFVERVMQVYPALRDALPRVEFIRSTYALQQALYALRIGNKADFDEGIRAYI